VIRILLCLVILFSISSVGISQTIEKHYVDEQFAISEAGEMSEYYREVTLSESRLWLVTIFYNPSGKVKMTGSYTDEELEAEEGEFIYYYRNGNIESKGMCSEGIKYGVWERYLWDGSRRADRYYSGTTVDDFVNSKHRLKSASFPGGEEAMYAYIAQNTEYPEPAIAKSIEGTVEISFAISQHGDIMNPSITKSANYYLDKEAERLVSAMPIWEPAMKGGYYLQSTYVLPIEFKLPE